MEFLKGTQAQCKAYNDHVASERGLPAGTITRWAYPIERDGDFYIRKHPDYPATSGLTEADLPPAPEDTDGI